MAIPAPITGGQQLPEREWQFEGFNLGNNTFALATELKGSELAFMLNAELYGKRSIRPRRGSESLGNAINGVAPVDGLFQHKAGVSDNQLLGLSGGLLKKYNISTGGWDSITGGTFTSGLRTRATKMQDNSYFGNGVDNFTRYNGTIVETFTAVAAPTGGVLTNVGAAGTTYYEYSVTTVTSKGESLESTLLTTSTGNATLDATNKNRVVFNRRTESIVIGYNLYGRSNRGRGRTLMKYIEQPASGATVTFDDDGTLDPQVWLPPEGDSTDGLVVALWEQLRGSLIGAKDPNNPHRLYFSGTGEKYESFSPAHNGGWVDVRPGDNDNGINGLAPFESRMIVAKQRSIHNFQFSAATGDAVIQELITYTGCGAPGSMVVMENDVAFIDDERRLRILGYEPNFNAAIRTTSLSEGRTQSLFDDINPTYIENCEAVYFNGQYKMAYTPQGETVNKKVIKYDRKYLSFLGTDDGADAHVRCWCIWDGRDKKQRLYAGSSDSSMVYEYGVEGELTNHTGSAVECTIRTRNEDLGNSGQSKLFKWADFRIYRIQGSLQIKTIINGATELDTKGFSSTARTGWGVARWGTTRWGVSTGVGASLSDLDKTYRKEIYEIASSLQFEITKEGAQDDFVLVSMRGEALMLPTEVFPSENVI